jgi:hypothetical protein
VKVLDTASDEHGLSVLLARSSDRPSLYKASRQVREDDPEAVLEVLHGSTKWGPEAGEALRQNIERLKNGGDWVSVNSW